MAKWLLRPKKTRTYITFKKTLGLEKYLLANSNSSGRAYHTSLRSGTNILEIEKADGRVCTKTLDSAPIVTFRQWRIRDTFCWSALDTMIFGKYFTAPLFWFQEASGISKCEIPVKLSAYLCKAPAMSRKKSCFVSSIAT